VLPRPSFRQLLLAAFVLVALLLGGVALRGQLALEALLEKGRDDAARTLSLSAHAERLDELALAMERVALRSTLQADGEHNREVAERWTWQGISSSVLKGLQLPMGAVEPLS
jgi:two-component system sensor histidine kinase GlrK